MEKSMGISVSTYPQQSYDRPKVEQVPGVATTDNKTTPTEQVDNRFRKEASKHDLDRSIEGLNKLMQLNYTHVSFVKHEKLNEYYVRIINDSTNEVIREIPSKKVLDAVAEMDRIVGLLIDHKG